MRYEDFLKKNVFIKLKSGVSITARLLDVYRRAIVIQILETGSTVRLSKGNIRTIALLRLTSYAWRNPHYEGLDTSAASKYPHKCPIITHVENPDFICPNDKSFQAALGRAANKTLKRDISSLSFSVPCGLPLNSEGVCNLHGKIRLGKMIGNKVVDTTPEEIEEEEKIPSGKQRKREFRSRNAVKNIAKPKRFLRRKKLNLTNL